jgi:hypothetical protein
MEVAHGKKAVVTFDEAALCYLDNGGSPRFLGNFDPATCKWSGMMSHLFGKPLRGITQENLNDIAKTLYPNVRPDTLNRQFWTPFIAVWRHAITQKWCDPVMWIRPKKKVKGTAVETGPKRVGSYPVEYETAWRFIPRARLRAASRLHYPLLHRPSAYRVVRHEHIAGQRAGPLDHPAEVQDRRAARRPHP